MNTLKHIINEHIEWRQQVFLLAKADIIKMYSGAALGWAWALVKPITTITVFWFAFTYGLRSGSSVNGYTFILWMMPGFVAWFYMSDMLGDGASAIRKYKFLVTKMKFPVSIIPTFTSIARLAVHIVLIALVCLVFIVSGVKPDLYWIQLIIYMTLMVVFWTFWGLFASMLGAMSKDFINLVRSFTQPVFWLSGIIWDVNNIENGVLKTLLYFNPVTYLATGYRNCFIYKTWFWEQPTQLAGFLALTVLMLALGVWSYKKLIREIPDVL